MDITREMQEAMIVSLLRHDATPSGVECSFFQFGAVGVKFYGYGDMAQEKARKAYWQQCRCYDAGFAPKPGKTFSIAIKGAGNGESMFLHGYTTEVAVMLRAQDMIPDKERAALYEGLRNARLPCGDLHPRNVGYVVDEKTNAFKLVPIDFGWHFAGLED